MSLQSDLLDHYDVAEVQLRYQEQGKQFYPVFNYAVYEATRGIKDPKAHAIVGEVLRILFEGLNERYQAKPAHNWWGRMGRFFMNIFAGK